LYDLKIDDYVGLTTRKINEHEDLFYILKPEFVT